MKLEDYDVSKAKEVLVAHRKRFVSTKLDRKKSEYWGINFKIPTFTPIIGNLTEPKKTVKSPYHLRRGPTLRQLSKVN